MSVSRRTFIEWAGSVSALALVTPDRAGAVPFLMDDMAETLRPDLLPSVDELWDWQVWMNKLGPKFTGNDAHRSFVEFLASRLKALGLDVSRDTYKFTRWDARRWGISIAPATGQPFEAPVTSYYPYSGQTPRGGVTGELIAPPHVSAKEFNFGRTFEVPGDIAGKILFYEMPLAPPPYHDWYKVWGRYTADTAFPTGVSAVWGIGTPLLTDLKKAGAAGVILSWTNVSDEQAAHQYAPFSRPLQDLPALWVGKETGARLRKFAGTGARATVTLEADVVPDTSSDTLIAMLPGSTPDEVIIINTHTDGPNATEENGGVGILALAKYFSQLPKPSRKRSIAFVLTTGHFCLAQLPSMRGVIDKHPELIRKTVAALTVEHLGCREWLDNAAGKYASTGKDELSLAITDFEPMAPVMLESVNGTTDRRVAVVKSNPGPFFGEGGALSRAGIPTIGYIPIPSYLIAAPPDGCIDKLSKTLMHGQIEAFAKAIHTIDTMTAAQLKGHTDKSA